MAPKKINLCQLCGSNELPNRLSGSYPRLPPLVSTFLQTNDPPSSLEEAEILEMRENLGVEITDLDLRINKLCKELAPLIKTRHRKFAEYEKCDAARSPLRRLPPEIIREIFTYLYDPSPSDPRVESYHMRRPRLQDMPWVVSWVCRSWRSVALDLSCMWTNVRVGSVGHPSMPPRLSTLLERARERRLAVSFARGWPYPDLHSLEIILSNAYRWRRLHLDRNFDFLAPARGKLQSLEVLQLDIMGIFFNQDESPLVNEGVPNGLESLPSLHTLITWPETCLMASWLPRSQITYLNLAEGPIVISSTQLRQILETFPNIKHLNTKAPTSGGGGGGGSDTPLEHKSLEKLTIHIERKWRTKHPNYLSKITFPSLRSIRIRQTAEESSKAIKCLAQLLKDSKCPLEEITWWLDDSDPEPTAPQLRFTSSHYMPLFRLIDWESVQTLTISAPTSDGQALYNALSNRYSRWPFGTDGGPTFLFPELKTLNLITAAESCWGESDAFKKMREWRSELWVGVFRDWEDWEGVGCLRVYPSEPRMPDTIEYDLRDYL